MKNVYMVFIGIMLVCMLCIPALSLKQAEIPDLWGQEGSIVTKEATFRVFDSKTKKIKKIQESEYLFGVLAAEMPPTFHEEALKAQVVAAYTFAMHRKTENSNGISGYDITTDSAIDQAYMPRAEAREKWGDKADEYCEKLDKAIKAVKGYVITDDGKPILAAYHAISGGKTESSKVVWGCDYSYLQPVESIGDLLAPDYLTQRSFKTDDFKDKLKESGTKFGSDVSKYIGAIVRSESGTVVSIKVCGKSFSGDEIRKYFSLRSANFDLAYANGSFNFTVRGCGHGVGMSQYGAEYLAKQGSTYVEILSWYYQGCKMQKLS